MLLARAARHISDLNLVRVLQTIALTSVIRGTKMGGLVDCGVPCPDERGRFTGFHRERARKLIPFLRHERNCKQGDT